MKYLFNAVVLVSAGLVMVLLPVACRGGEIREPNAHVPRTVANPSAEPDSATAAQSRLNGQVAAVVIGTVTYRERILLPPDTTLAVELRDVSLIDGASRLIARQVSVNPGQVPIPFRLEYDRADVQAGNTYAVQASIAYADGSLAFTSDTSHEVITQGRPAEADLILMMVSPPPVGAPTEVTPMTGDWQTVPAPIKGAEIAEYDEGYLLTVTYFLPGGKDCARHQGLRAELVGTNLHIVVNSLVKRAADGSPACASPPGEGTVEIPMEEPFILGETYLVRINERLTNAFTPPPADYGDSTVVPSLIEEAELLILEIFPPRYNVRVVSALPLGSSCSAFNGFAVTRPEHGRIKVLITHHETGAADGACTEDRPLVETTVPLGGDFESGREYAINLNDRTITFRAQ